VAAPGGGHARSGARGRRQQQRTLLLLMALLGMGLGLVQTRPVYTQTRPITGTFSF